MKGILKDKNIFARHGLYSIKFLIKFLTYLRWLPNGFGN